MGYIRQEVIKLNILDYKDVFATEMYLVFKFSCMKQGESSGNFKQH